MNTSGPVDVVPLPGLVHHGATNYHIALRVRQFGESGRPEAITRWIHHHFYNKLFLFLAAQES